MDAAFWLQRWREALLGRHIRIRLLHTLDAPDNNRKLTEHGPSRLQGNAYLLQRL